MLWGSSCPILLCFCLGDVGNQLAELDVKWLEQAHGALHSAEQTSKFSRC